MKCLFEFEEILVHYWHPTSIDHCLFPSLKKGKDRDHFSQLYNQYMVRHDYAKNFEGFKTRILSKITTMTTVWYINEFIICQKQ